MEEEGSTDPRSEKKIFVSSIPCHRLTANKLEKNKRMSNCSI